MVLKRRTGLTTSAQQTTTKDNILKFPGRETTHLPLSILVLYYGLRVYKSFGGDSNSLLGRRLLENNEETNCG